MGIQVRKDIVRFVSLEAMNARAHAKNTSGRVDPFSSRSMW